MKYTITKSESLNGTYTEYAEGDFSSVSSGDKLEILNESVPTGVNYYYKVYLWIDGSTGSGATYYTFERGTTVYTNRPTNWSGYVGLAYSSDYIYTFANGVDETCFNNGSKCTTPGAVPTSSWMVVMKGVTSWWLITPASGWDNYVYEIGNGDYSGASYVYNTYNIHSVLYLKLEVELTVEETSGNPY